MDKDQIASALSEIAQVLELNGENPFKVRAYLNAARIVEGLSDDIEGLIERGELIRIKGIGKNLAGHIAELARTGGVAEYEGLMKSLPEGVRQMLSIPGLGPKKVAHLWKDRGLKSLDELEAACRSHLLSEDPGFGEKTERKILDGIEMVRRFAGKSRFDEAYASALEVIDRVSSWPEVERCEIAGSIRRRKEIVKDIDILISTGKPAEAMERFVSMEGVARVVQHGKTKSEVILDSGIQCDLRAVADAEYPFALHYFTGSKEHNVEMRRISKEKGLKLNEYGLFEDGAKQSISCADETRLFGALGMDFIPPELRENTGEVEAARAHALPKLIEESDVVGVIHVHSTYTDGECTIEEMARAAKGMGYGYIAICDHSQAVTVAGGMKPADVRRQWKEIDAVNGKLKGIRVLKGIEVDILADGALDFSDEILAGFDVVIAAVHSRFGMSEGEMTDRIVRAISNPHVDILAHPTGRLLLSRDPYAVDLKKVIDAACEHNVALEINSHPQRLDLDWRWCKFAKERGAKFAICPDAHSTEGIEAIFFGVGVARKGWLEREDVINCLPADMLLKLLAR